MGNIELMNTDIDEQLDAIRSNPRISSKESGLALSRLAHQYQPWVEEFVHDAPDSSDQLVVALTNLKARVDYLLEEAERELRAHVVVTPDDVQTLEELAAVLTTLGRRSEATRVSEEARRIRRNPKESKIISMASKRDSTGLLLEQKTLELARLLGFKSQTTARTADGGIDINAYSTNPFTSGLYIIQCKDWSKPVGEPIIRDLLGTVRKNNAVKGILVARAGFTESARRFAQGTPIDLIDGSGIDSMLRDLRSKQPADLISTRLFLFSNKIRPTSSRFRRGR